MRACMIICWLVGSGLGSSAQVQVIDSAMHHLRNAGTREWAEFADNADRGLNVTFNAIPDTGEHTLILRQYDVKFRWSVVLNGQSLGSLVEDEKDLLCYLKIPAGLVKEKNTLEVSAPDARGDDVRVGEIVIHRMPLNNLLKQGRVDVQVLDHLGSSIPSRLTIVNEKNILQPFTASSDGALATRVGHVYTGSGNVTIGLPEGKYTIYATRGFEYGVDSVAIDISPGDHHVQQLRIEREVNTAGWASSDTHIHTFTWSKHGDATSEERVVTIAGEGIELPVITDHNTHVDLNPVARKRNVESHFSLMNGNELTTQVGHFNIFPVEARQPVSHTARNWKDISENLGEAPARAVILNHARDIHSGFRPFDPSLHLAVAGLRLDGWKFPANAMEILNSGSQQSDQMQLTHDWLGMLNGGYVITPAGASDSHDVSRFIVGQSRTYIRCNDDDPGDINIKEAVKNFIDGNVTVSFGLMTLIEINDTYGPGELAPASDEAKVTVTVLGPKWVNADKVTLYANGEKIREADIPGGSGGPLKWQHSWNLTVPTHDIFLVAVAEGPGKTLSFWPIAKPFQPVSIDWSPRIFGITGAVWLDGDHNRKRNPAREYAARLIQEAGGDMNTLIQRLSTYHESVAVQAAALLHLNGKRLNTDGMLRALERATPETRTAFERIRSAVAAD